MQFARTRTSHILGTVIGNVIAATVFVISLNASNVAVAADKLPFSFQGIDTFDGSSWSGLTIGSVTKGSLRQRGKTGRGSYPSSMELRQSDPNFRVDGLFNGKGDDSQLDGFYVEPRAPYPTLSAVIDVLGNPTSEDLYPDVRVDNWHFVHFPSKGILLMAVSDSLIEKSSRHGEDKVIGILLGPSDRISRVCTNFHSYPGPVQVPAKTASTPEFGAVNFKFDLNGLNLDEGQHREAGRNEIEALFLPPKPKPDSTANSDNDKDINLKDALKEGLKLMLLGPDKPSTSTDPQVTFLKYRQGAPGALTVDVAGEITGKTSGRITVTCTVETVGPYGPVTSTSSSSKRVGDTIGGFLGSIGSKGDELQQPQDCRTDITSAINSAVYGLPEQIEKSDPANVRKSVWSTVADEYFATGGR